MFGLRLAPTRETSMRLMTKSLASLKGFPWASSLLCSAVACAFLKDYPLSLEQYGECGHDPLGYFIIHGSEPLFILCQER